MAKVEIVTERTSGGAPLSTTMVRVDGHWLIDGRTGRVREVGYDSIQTSHRAAQEELRRICAFLQREEHRPLWGGEWTEGATYRG